MGHLQSQLHFPHSKKQNNHCSFEHQAVLIEVATIAVTLAGHPIGLTALWWSVQVSGLSIITDNQDTNIVN